MKTNNIEQFKKNFNKMQEGGNNGDTSILAKTCPEGFVPGRLK